MKPKTVYLIASGIIGIIGLTLCLYWYDWKLFILAFLLMLSHQLHAHR